MNAPIELHAYMGMADYFRERQWPNPRPLEIAGELTGAQLLAQLGVAQDKVEVMFVNRKAYAADIAVVRPGDRVALVPPGVPGPHRFLLGFKNRN
jgi:sulfur carrier protein ThiS